jgi:hypothetical protein
MDDKTDRHKRELAEALTAPIPAKLILIFLAVIVAIAGAFIYLELIKA